MVAPTQRGWRLIWNDEFDGASGAPPDPRNWEREIGGGGWGNNEWEYYTDSPDNACLNGEGSLVITARAATPEQHTLPCWYGTCRYTSARLLTRNRFEMTYGKAEARLKIPFGQGIWPAFWMLGTNMHEIGWPACGEIDIMENIGREPATIHGTVHGPGYCGGQAIGGAYSLPNNTRLHEQFHTFAVEWEAAEIRWLMDDIPYFQFTPARVPQGASWVFDHPFFLLLNVAVGGHWPGYPDETSTFPQTMLVDYVRVYAPA